MAKVSTRSGSKHAEMAKYNFGAQHENRAIKCTPNINYKNIETKSISSNDLKTPKVPEHSPACNDYNSTRCVRRLSAYQF